LGESADYVRAGCGEDVVDRVRRRDDAAAAAGGNVARLPGDDVACFFGVKSLGRCVSIWNEGLCGFVCKSLQYFSSNVESADLLWAKMSWTNH
jgi:hypothetical protein